MTSFRPHISVETWKQRLQLTGKLHQFFAQREIMEVHTPILSRSSALDPAIDVFEADYFIDGASHSPRTPRYLSTSPEFHMKRLLASGFPDIYQLSPAFRNGESGTRHNPEFTILEWYRRDYTQHQLMSEVIDLIQTIHPGPSASEITYQQAFIQHTQLDPFACTIAQCQTFIEHAQIPTIESTQLNDYLDYILGLYITPLLGCTQPQFLIEWPADQAALAQTYTDNHGHHVAARFELYIHGLELCNGYQELTDPIEQARRFTADTHERQQLHKRLLHTDHRFLAALDHGMPQCAGVAVGWDRLLMLALGANDISQVLLFSDPIA